MANTDKPFGFKPIGHALGLNWTDKVHIYYVPSTDSTALFLYDLVEPAGSADSTGIYATVKQATAGQTDLLGSVVGFGLTPEMAFDATNLSRAYRAASEALYVAVVDDPYVIYEAQEDSDSSSLAATDVMGNADIIVGSGDTTTGLSAMEIDSDTNTTSTANIRILGLVNRADNVLGTNAKWRCMINEHALKGTSGS